MISFLIPSALQGRWLSCSRRPISRVQHRPLGKHGLKKPRHLISKRLGNSAAVPDPPASPWSSGRLVGTVPPVRSAKVLGQAASDLAWMSRISGRLTKCFLAWTKHWLSLLSALPFRRHRSFRRALQSTFLPGRSTDQFPLPRPSIRPSWLLPVPSWRSSPGFWPLPIYFPHPAAVKVLAGPQTL